MDDSQKLISISLYSDENKDENKVICKKNTQPTKGVFKNEGNDKKNVNFKNITYSIYTNQLIMQTILKYINCYDERKILESLSKEIQAYSRNIPCKNFKKLGNKRVNELSIYNFQSNFLLQINGITKCFNLNTPDDKNFNSEYKDFVDFILHFSKKIKHLSLHTNGTFNNSFSLSTSFIIYENFFNFLPKNLYTTSIKYTHIKEDNKKYFFLLIKRQCTTNMCLHSCKFYSNILELSYFKMPKLLNLSIHLQNSLTEVAVLINKCSFVQNLFVFVYLKHDEGFIERDWENLLDASKNITTFTFSIYALCDCHNENCFYYTSIPQFLLKNRSKLEKSNGEKIFKLEYMKISNYNHKIECNVCKSYFSYIDRKCFVCPENLVTLERNAQEIICLRTAQISKAF